MIDFNYWNEKISEIPDINLHITKEGSNIFLNWNFGCFGKIHIEVTEETVLEKLYDILSNAKKYIHTISIGCRCWSDEYDEIKRKFDDAFVNYCNNNDVGEFVKIINEYRPQYRENTKTIIPRYDYKVFGITECCYIGKERNDFLSKLLENIEHQSEPAICMRSYGRIGKWFHYEYEIQTNKPIRIIHGYGKSLTLDTDDPVEARICSAYDEWRKKHEFELDPLFHPNMKDKIEKLCGNKIKELISNFDDIDLFFSLINR